jgi:hypothetical protein
MPQRGISREIEWFDREVRGSLGIDVFRVPVDRDKGLAFGAGDRCDLMCCRIEDIAESFSAAKVHEFLATSRPVEIKSRNVGSAKSYSGAYRRCRERLRFDRALLEDIYSDAFCTHFYPPRMIEQFIQEWSGR